MSLDRDDDHPVWFLAHLVEALRPVRPQLVVGLEELLEAHAEDAARHVLPVLIDAVDGSGLPLVLFVDDWHRIGDPRAVAAMEFLLDHASPLLRLVVTSRSRTGLPLGRLRVRDQLVELDESSLSFDPAESSRLLVGLHRLPLRDGDVLDLHETTDGWVAALQLASLSLRGQQDPRRWIQDLSGRHHAIDAYLAENVLDRLPDDVLDFLLRTSTAGRLCADLVGALTGGVHGQGMLERVEAADLFLHPMDEDRTWFQYHHLFAEFLRLRLDRDRPAEVRGLHLRAAHWFATHDLTSEAVDHALAAGDPELAVDYVTEAAMPLFEHSRTANLLALVDKLPPALVADRARLQMALGWADTVSQRRTAALRAAGELERILRLGTDPGIDAAAAEDLRRELRLLHVSLDMYADLLDDLDPVAEEVLARPAEMRPWLVTLAAGVDTFVSLHRFDFDAARHRQVWALPFHERAGGFLIGGLGLCLAGIAALEQLDVEGARRHLTMALSWGEGDAGRRSYMPQMVIAQLGALAYAVGDLGTAERYLDEARELGERGVVDLMLPPLVILSRIRAAAGDLPGAAVLLEAGSATARDLGLVRIAAAVHEERARWGLPDADGPPAPLLTQSGIATVVSDSLGAARILRSLHSGSASAARAALPGATLRLARIEGRHRPLAALGARVLLVGVLQQAGRPDDAVRELLPALQVAARTGVIGPVAEGGAPVAATLDAILRRARSQDRTPAVEGVPDEMLHRMLEAARRVPPSAGTSATPLLNGRETQILHLLDAGRSNQQIARRLDLSTNTVKWYLKALYVKFDVSRRQEAVAEARARGLLP